MSTPNWEQASTRGRGGSWRAVEVVAVVEDTVEKGQRIGAVHTAARTTIQPKTVGSARKSKTNSKHSHANVHEMPAAMVMLSSVIIVVNPVICAMNAN